MSKGQLMMRIVAGGYLAYVGFGIARDVIAERPDNFVIYLIVSIIFMVLGGIWCVQALRKYIKHDYVDIWREDREETPKRESSEPSVAEVLPSEPNAKEKSDEEPDGE